MDGAKTVGVVIPSFNPGNYLAEAIASVRRQTFTDFHIYVVDDGSTILPEVEAAEDLTFVARPNAGVSRARNYATALGREPFVAFLDQDDLWHPDKLSRQVAVLRDHPDAAGCFTWAVAIDAAGHVTGGAYGAYEQDITAGRALGGGVILSSLMLRRTAFAEAGGFDPALLIVQDWDLLVRASRVGPILACHDRLTSYRVHESNASRDFRRLASESRLVLDRIAAGLPDRDRAALYTARRDFARLAADKARAQALHDLKGRQYGAAVAGGLWTGGQLLRAGLLGGRARWASGR